MLHGLLSVALVAITGPSSTAAAARPTTVEVPDGIVRPIRDIQVPARQPGVLRKVHVREGSMARADEVLAQIDDSEAQLRRAVAVLEYEAAAAQASEDVKVQEAKATHAVAQAEYADSEEANRRSPGAVQKTQLRREQLTAERAGLQVKVAEMEFTVAKITADVQQAKVKLIEHEIDTRRITAPFSGLVSELLRQEGEWVQAGDPVLHLVQMDRLRVEGWLDAGVVAPHEVIGRKARVRVKLPAGQVREVEAIVSYASQLVEADRKYRVHVELENVPVLERDNQTYWLIRPGMFADVTIFLGPTP